MWNYFYHNMPIRLKEAYQDGDELRIAACKNDGEYFQVSLPD